MTGLDSGATRFLAALLLVGLVVPGEAQFGPTLDVLTMPNRALPSDCALKQPAAKPAPGPRAQGTVNRSVEWSPFPTNPWSGTDRKLVAEVRRVIDGTPRLPDGPPLEPRDTAVFLLKWADDIVDAHRAVYASSDGSEVGVWAVRFNHGNLAKPEPPPGTIHPPRSRGFRSRLVLGATVVLVTAPASDECVRAIEGYIRSLK
jgi:hypothetical protein